MIAAVPGEGRSRIAVVGCGHVGVVTAACLASLGHAVRGIDSDSGRVTALDAGGLISWEPGLAEVVSFATASGRLDFTTSFAEGLTGADFVFLCVSTPATPTGAADLSNVRAAVGAIAAALKGAAGRPLIVNKSTSPIGTAETIEGLLARAFPSGGRPAPAIASNPEFLREGHAVEDFFHPQRIVIGVHDRADGERVAALYRPTEAPVLVTDLRTAEMIKYVSNAFLATRVAFANEVARLCEGLGVEARAVLAGAALDPRIGGQYLQPGIGFGGSCLPKDVAALCHTADSAAVPVRLLPAIAETNAAQKKHAVNCIRRLVGGLEGRTIAAWGATFKGGTDDLRESPALDVIGMLRNEGARIQLYDPAVPAGTVGLADETCGDAVSALQGADALAVLTDWPQFASVEPRRIAAALPGKAVYDGRNVLDGARLSAAGLRYLGVGGPWPSDPQPAPAPRRLLRPSVGVPAHA